MEFLSPIDAPSSGGTAIKFLDAATFASTGTAIKFLDPVSLIDSALPDITPIGSPITLSGATSGNQNLTLPAAVAAGDSLLVMLNGDTQTAMVTGPSGSVAVYNGGFGNDGQSYGALVYRLEAADITVGSITVNVQNATQNWTLTAQVFRGVSQLPIDVSAFTGSPTAVASPITLTATGITTIQARDMLVYQGVPDRRGSATGTFGAYPAGWTRIADNLHTWSDQTSGYMLQFAAGATGNITVTYTSADQAAPGAGLIALKKASPTIVLDLSGLAVSGVTGALYSGVVKAALIDGATAAPTITVDALPAGLTLGTTTYSAGVYSATVTGTPTTVQTLTSHFSASNGAQADATGSVGYSIGDGSASLSLAATSATVGWTDASFKTSYAFASGVAVEAGDTVVIVAGWNSPNATSSATDTDGALSVVPSEPAVGSRNKSAGVFYHTVATASANYTFTLNWASSHDGARALVYVLRGASVTYQSASRVANSNDYSAGACALGTLSTSGRAFVAIAANDDYSGQGAFTLSPSGYTIDANDATGNNLLAAHKLATTAITGDALAVGDPGTSQGGYNRITGLACAFTY